MRDPRALLLPGVLALAWLLFSIPHGLTGLDLLAGGAAVAAGAVLGAAWPALHGHARRALELTDDLMGEARDGAAPAGVPDVDPALEGDPDRLDPIAAEEALEALLRSLADELGALRVVVWDVDRAADTVTPLHVLGARPHAMAAAGDPLAWALDERCELRLDPAPPWARGAAVAAPVDARRVLTVETDVEHPVEPARVRHAGRLLAPVLALHDQQADGLAATRRLDRVVEFLRSVPAENDPHRMPEGLARVGIEIVGGTGALVASWAADGGEVLARAGVGGGPMPGDTFGLTDGDLAHAARTATVIRRRPGDPGPPLASDRDRWERPAPPYRVTIPLVDPAGTTRGVLAGWGAAPPAEQGVALMESLGPLLAVQLSQASDLAHYRDRADVDALTGLPNRGALEDRMSEETSRFHRYRRSVALLVVDLDHFKRINDTHGHDAGDAVLRRVAQVLRVNIRDVDFAARFGGEELVVVMPETLLHAAVDAAERVRHAIRDALIEHDGTRIPVTASIGVSACPECVDEPEALFGSADQALYLSKEAGRDRVTAAALKGAVAGPGG